MSSAPLYPLSTIAKLLMLSERRVQQLAQQGIIPKAARGKYELAPAVQGYIKFLQERTLGNNDEFVDAHKEKARYQKAKADLAEMEAEEKRGEVVRLDAVGEYWAEQCARISALLMGVPNKVTPEIIGETDRATINEKIESHIREALTELANDFAEQASAGSAGEPIADDSAAT